MKNWGWAMGATAALALGWMFWSLPGGERPVASARSPHRPDDLVRNDRDRGRQAWADERPDSAVASPPALDARPPQLLADGPTEGERCSRTVGDEGCDFLNPSTAELIEMARCGTVKVDYPVGLLDDSPFHLNDALVHAANLDEPERRLVEAATEEFRAELKQQLTPISRDLGIVADVLATAPLQSIVTEIQLREIPKELQGTRKELSRERAGLSRASAPRTPTERFEHIFVGLGEAYQAKIARVLGSERAADLRAIKDGWGATVVASGSCDGEEEAAKD